MTLILGTLSRKHAIQVSDRRTTSVRGIESEKVTKSLSLTCEDGRFAIGYAGLAQAGSFDTRLWIIEALGKCAAPDFSSRGITRRLTELLAADFDCSPDIRRLTLSQRRLSIMFSGFEKVGSDVIPSVTIISNYQDVDSGAEANEAWPEFRGTRFAPESNEMEVTLYQCLGMNREITDVQNDELLSMLKSGVPPGGLAAKMVELIRIAAERPSSRGGIGQNAMSCIVPADFAEPISGNYYSAEIGHVIYLPDQITLSSQNILLVRDIQLARTADSPPLVVPPQARKQLCACGSGKKYKRCHGR